MIQLKIFVKLYNETIIDYNYRYAQIMGKLKLEHLPWIEGYKKISGGKPLWSQHGMPSVFEEFVKLVKDSKLNGYHLDIGCGDGSKTVNFALAGLKTIGIDISKDAIKRARHLINKLHLSSKCRVLKADCLDLPKNLPPIASISDILVYTHLKEDEQVRYRQIMHKIIIDGGFVLEYLFSDEDLNFHGHPVSTRYDFQFDPENLLMAGFDHYQNMHNVHYNEDTIRREFIDFKIVKLKKVVHPVQPHRFIWEVILQIDNHD